MLVDDANRLEPDHEQTGFQHPAVSTRSRWHDLAKVPHDEDLRPGAHVAASLTHNDLGLLPPGLHKATLDEVETAFVSDASGTIALRRAVFAGVTAWVRHTRFLLGAGTCWISGGFISVSEPDDTALVAYEPDDRALAGRVANSDLAADLHNLTDVVYRAPNPGGRLPQRWPVSGLVDAHLVDTTTRRAYLTGFAAVTGANGLPTPGVTKGVVEVAVS